MPTNNSAAVTDGAFESLLVIAESALDSQTFRPLNDTLDQLCDYVRSRLGCLAVLLRVSDDQARLVVGGHSAERLFTEDEGEQGLGNETLSRSIRGQRDPSVEVFASGRPRFVLTSEIDPESGAFRRLTAVGIESIFFHPVVRQGVTIGVLACYWPYVHELTTEESSLVALMARLAAISIATATFAARSEELRLRLEELSTQLQNDNSRLRQLHLAQSRMIQILSDGSSLTAEQLARSLASALDRSVMISDPSGAELAMVASPGCAGLLREVAKADAGNRPNTETGGNDGESYTLLRLNVPGTRSSLGALVVCPAIDDDDEFAHVMTRQAAVILASHLHAQKSDSTFSTLVLPSALLAVSRELFNSSQLKEASAWFGVSRDVALTLSLISTPTPEAAVRLSRAGGAFASAGWNVLTAVADGQDTLVLLSGPPVDARTARALTTIQPQIECVGFSSALAGLEDIPRGLQEARVAKRLASSAGKIAFYDVLGSFAEVTGSMTVTQMVSFVSGMVGAVQEYDEKRGTQLLETLKAHIEHDGRLPETAGALSVHVNTLHKRLTRIEKLAGVDLRSFRDISRLTLALDIMPTLTNLWSADRPVEA
jgi:enamine deaminase RidA (YjgF/YER057c/UK114 family)